jgi:sulfide:quinone oxidoreductase
MAGEQRFRVLIAGGGVAALEVALALSDLAGDRVTLEIVAPNEDFVYRPMAVVEPFAYAPPQRVPLAAVAADVGAELRADAFAWVEPARRIAHTEQGVAVTYDALVLALGARMRAPFANAITIDDRRMDEVMHGIVQDVEGGYVRSVAFVSPNRLGWPLPLYELALLTARRSFEMGVDVDVTVVTPEPTPLSVFGDEASSAVAALLADAGVHVITCTEVQVPEPGRVTLQPDDRELRVDRVIALPELFGPAVRGLPAGEHGFIPIDQHCQVAGVPGVYAAGDATDYIVKHGGIASQQADTAAEAVAALAGAAVTPEPFRPEIRGVLLTGGAPRYLTARLAGGRGLHSEVTDEPTWSPPTKIAARYLAPYLERRARQPAH